MLSLIKAKLFWLGVPQMAGMFNGIIMGSAMVLY